MRKLGIACAMVLSLAAAAAPARADFIKDYRAWQQLGQEGQAAYAMAIFDVMTVFVANDKYTAARAFGLRKCAETLKLRAGMIAQAITKFYVDFPEQQGLTPFMAFNTYFERGACSPFINEFRKEMGLKLMKEPPKEKPPEENPPQ